MADETRRKRRDARRAAGGAAGDGAAELESGHLTQEGAENAAANARYAKKGGFVRESWAELKKVEWPNRDQLIQGTIVVIFACAVTGAFLWGVDQVMEPFVQFLIGE